MANGARELRQPDTALFDLRSPARRTGLVVGDAVEQMRHMGQAFERGAFLVLEPGHRAAETERDGFHVAQDLALAAQRVLLAGERLRGVDLARLEAQQVGALAAQALVSGGALEARGERRVTIVGSRDPIEEHLDRLAGAAIEPGALQVGLDQPELLALAMDAQQERRDVGEQPERRRRVRSRGAPPGHPTRLRARPPRRPPARGPPGPRRPR